MSDDLARLRRWEDSGALWQVVLCEADQMEIVLLTCDAGEEMGRVRTSAPDVRNHVGGRWRSDEPAGTGRDGDVDG